MADYSPTTRIAVLKDVPLDDTYTDTRWFNSASEQTAFFYGKKKKVYESLSYQRVNNGIANPRVALTCRVPEVADNLYDCNYIMFQNANYGQKWFYAFIKQVNYINPNNTEIVYEIDYLQTFMFDIKIKPSFVVREHASAAEDIEFANLVPEPVGVGSWTEDIGSSEAISFSDITGENTSYIIIGFMPSDAISAVLSGTGFMIDGIYSGCHYAICESAGEANRFLIAVGTVGESEHIVGVWMTRLRPRSGNEARKKTITTTLNPKRLQFRDCLGGAYTVRNKKLLNSQFTYFKAFSLTGGSREWKPEYFVTDLITCVAQYCGVRGSEILIEPYYETTAGSAINADESLIFNESVQCTWASYGWINDAILNAFQFIASVSASSGEVGGKTLTYEGSQWGTVEGVGMSSYGGGGAGTAIVPFSTSVGKFTGNVGGPSGSPSMGVGGYRGVTTPVAEYSIQETPSVPKSIEGDFSSLFPAHVTPSTNIAISNTLLYSANYSPFIIKRMCPTTQELERLDTFFDMFGYQVNKVKEVNLDTRQAWNYVKLKQPCIYGSVPVEGMAIIKSAFSNGIRLWHVDAIGDYSIENPPK